MDIIVDSFVDRFNTALAERNIRPTELAEKTKLSRSTISHYMTGYTQPKSDKLFILSKALNVNEQWLMGFDVPMERQDHTLRLSKETKEYWKKTDVFEAELKVLGWDYELVGCQDWVYIDDGIAGLNDEGELVPGGKGRPIGCDHPSYGKVKCESCPERYAHYLFTNGEISFKVSMNDYEAFLNDSQTFFKERLQQLLRKSMKQMFSGNSINSTTHLLPNAAHERTDIEITDEMRKHDDDIMDDENF